MRRVWLARWKQVWQRRLSPANTLDDRGWFEVDIPLDRWAGQPIDIEFSQSAERYTGASLWMGGWEIPYLVSGPEGAEALPSSTVTGIESPDRT